MLSILPANAFFGTSLRMGAGISVLRSAFSMDPLPRARTARDSIIPARMPGRPLEISVMPLPPQRSPTSTEMMESISQVISSTAKIFFASTWMSISDALR